MNNYWSHAAMLLLGVTLSVGFYEGRSLVQNTAKAWTAATQMTSASAKRTRKEELQDHLIERIETAREERQAAPVAATSRVKKGNRRATPAPPLSQREPGTLTREQKVDLVKLRQRQRARTLEPGRMLAPGVAGAPLAGDRHLVPSVENLDLPLVDTGLEEPAP